MKIRPYSKKDDEQLIHLLRLNTPLYFAAAEEPDFRMYLDKFADHYFIVEQDGAIVGSGGFNLSDDTRTGKISWDIIHPEYQGKGIGKALTLYRINELRENYKVKQITVRTTQLVYRFYEKLGFVLEKTEKDFWAKGFDLYEMRLGV